MATRPATPFLLPFLILAALVGCERSGAATRASATAAAEEAELDPTSVTVFGERVLLFLEHPHLIRGESARFLAHFSVLADGEPVRSGRVTLEIGSTRLDAERPKRDGLFIPEGALATAGRFAGRLTLASEQASETLDLGEIVVHESFAEAAQAAEAAAGEDPPGAVPFLMEAQWKVKLLLAQAQPRTLLRRLTIPAQARLPEGAEAEVAPMVAGRLLAPAAGRLPVSGERVEAGQELASVEPALGAADLAQLQALALEFDLKALEVERASSDAAARLEFARRELERIRRLRENGLSTQQQLDQAERDFALAETESASARSTKAALDRLVAQRAARGAEGGLLSLRFALAAPLGGTIVARGRAVGESVDPDDVLFEILDASRMWVEGRASEFDLPLVESAVAATATFVGIPGGRFEAGTTAAGRPIWIGPVVDAATRTALVRCELDNRDGRIRAGMLAEIELGVERVEAAVSIPVDAVVMDQGLPTAYVMLDGEMFQKRDLELGIEDGGRVEVRRGVEAGEHVATVGAYIVKLAALSPASFGAGHAH